LNPRGLSIGGHIDSNKAKKLNKEAFDLTIASSFLIVTLKLIFDVQSLGAKIRFTNAIAMVHWTQKILRDTILRNLVKISAHFYIVLLDCSVSPNYLFI
jgi:hypothetical protein